ncbi:immunoglobulin-like domain containing receptor 1b precursor, partial [Silurus asotus]
LAIQVTVPQTERSTTLFASVILRCDYSTSVNQQEVLVTWRYKSFCLDPVLQYYSAERSTTLFASVILRCDYSTSVNQQEVLVTWRYKSFCLDPVLQYYSAVCIIKSFKRFLLIKSNVLSITFSDWLTVLLIILGAFLLITLFCICCCQCCPQNCCCYVRCPCCPETCCCPEKVVMQHKMMREAQKAMAPWLHGQPVYTHIGSNGSSQANPLLYSGSFSDHSSKHTIPMAQMAGPPLQPVPPMVLSNHVQANGSVHGSVYNNNQILDFLENQVRGINGEVLQPATHYVATHLPPQQAAHQPQHMHNVPPMQPITQSVPFSTRPPSMLSALDEMGVHGVERRVIQLPPIVGRAPSLTSRRGPRETRAVPRHSSQSSGSSNRTGRNRDNSRYPGTSQHGILRSYSDESNWNDRRLGRSSREHRGDRDSQRSRSYVRSKAELIKELERENPQRERSYSPTPEGDFWSSEEEDDGNRRVSRSRDRAWPDKPPSYSSIEIQPRHSKRTSERNSVR